MIGALALYGAVDDALLRSLFLTYLSIFDSLVEQ